MGDVAMTVPVLNQILQDNRDLEITLITQIGFQPFFENIERLNVLGQDKNKLKSLRALFILSKSLWEREAFEQVLDLHGSLRARIISLFFWLRGIPVFKIQKGKEEKNRAIRQKEKILKPLKTSFNRYLDVFFEAGWNKNSVYIPDQDSEGSHWALLGMKLKGTWKKRDLFFQSLNSSPTIKPVLIGWAPFAGFRLKEMPLNHQIKVVHLLLERLPNAFIFLLAGPKQKELLGDFWLNTPFQNRLFFIGDWSESLREELSIIHELEILVSMDSANMHLGALLNRKVLGIYGTTHPDLGFSPFLQRQSGTFGLDGLDCRPCTVFGNGKCYRGDFACMNQINENVLVDEIIKRLF